MDIKPIEGADMTIPAKEIQNELTQFLEKKGFNVIKEWDVGKNSRDALNRNIYCPRVDIALGPFNTSREQNELMGNENIANQFITLLRRKNMVPVNFEYNYNPRCSIAIEIEASGSRKHMLGDIANASILGKLGIIIPTSNEKKYQFDRIKGFIDFATSVGKLEYTFRNYIIISVEEFKEIINLL